MARFEDREKAIVLRKKGMSYGQIKKELGISKSTLSDWLKGFPLSKERIRELRDCNEQRIERYRETMRKKREFRLNNFCEEQKKIIFPLSNKEFYLAGLFLYWGEGSKTSTGALAITNTDPSVIIFFINWLEKSLGLERDKIKVQLQLYSDMNPQEEINFWSKKLNISPSKFTRPYIKQTSSQRINHKGSFGHGTCSARIGNARTSEKILMGIRSIAEKNMRV